MPGALVYTDDDLNIYTDDDLNIVFCNDRFKEMYLVPSELLQSGRPYPAFLRHLAEHGYYGEGDVDALVARRVESLRHPSGRSFEDHAPGGRWFRILRRRVAAGGTVTVMTDVTEQKRVERDLADKEAELHVARANMPGARRVESLRHPSGKSFEDHAPAGRWFRILRRRVVAGGTVTVMTDITEQKAAERDVLEATRRTEEANKLNTEKNRMLEALSSEPRDKNRQLEEQAAQIAEWNARLETRVTEQVAQIGPPRIFSKVEPQIEAEPVGELSLKGFHRPVFAHNVLGIRPEA